MSTPTNPEAAAIVNLYSSVFIGNCCGLAGTVFLIYEWVLTSARTVNMFWATKSTGASVLFLANRYISFSTNVLGLFLFISISGKSLIMFAQANAVIGMAQFVPWAAFSALRVLALCRNWTISGLVLLLSVAPFGINLTQFHYDLTGVDDPKFGCSITVNTPPELAKKLTILSRSCLIVSDAIAISVTWYTMPRRRTYYMEAGQNTSTLSGILLRDGTIYFILLFILNSLHLALTMVSLDTAFAQTSYMTLFTQPVTAVIVSRFLLDLQSASRKAHKLGHENNTITHGHSSVWSVPVESVEFAGIVGSISSSLPEDLNAQSGLDDETERAGSSDGDEDLECE